MFFNSRNGQGHFARYFQHRFFVDAAENEDPAALRGKRVDHRLDLAQGFTGVELCFHIILALQQLQIGDGFETHHLVPPGRIDHQISGNGEKIGATRGHIFPVVGSVGAGKNLRDHILQFLIGGQDPPETPPESSFLWQDHCLEPFQLSANPLHDDPLVVSRASPAFICLS